MSTVKIDFSDLHDAARKARDASKEMDAYGRALPDKVSRPLDSLTGGSSGNTSTVRDLARRKQQQLQQRSDAYQDIARGLDAFADHAKETDEDVKRVIDRVADKRAENLNWLQKMMYQGYKFMNGIFGATEFGALVNDVIGWGDYLAKRKHEACKALLDWFKHGDGKYVLNIVIAGLAIVGAVAGAILAFPVSGVLATIVAIATVIGAVVTVVDSFAKIMANCKALASDSTEPATARYHGNVSSLEDWAKRETNDMRFQVFAHVFDLTGKIASAVAFFGGMGVHRAADGTNVATGKFDWKSKFGFKFDEELNHWKFDTKTLFGAHEELWSDDKKIVPEGFRKLELFKRDVSTAKNIFSTPTYIWNFDGKFDGLSDITNTTKLISSVIPGSTGFDKIAGYIDTAVKEYKWLNKPRAGIPYGLMQKAYAVR